MPIDRLRKSIIIASSISVVLLIVALWMLPTEKDHGPSSGHQVHSPQVVRPAPETMKHTENGEHDSTVATVPQWPNPIPVGLLQEFFNDPERYSYAALSCTESRDTQTPCGPLETAKLVEGVLTRCHQGALSVYVPRGQRTGEHDGFLDFGTEQAYIEWDAHGCNIQSTGSIDVCVNNPKNESVVMEPGHSEWLIPTGRSVTPIPIGNITRRPSCEFLGDRQEHGPDCFARPGHTLRDCMHIEAMSPSSLESDLVVMELLEKALLDLMRHQELIQTIVNEDHSSPLTMYLDGLNAGITEHDMLLQLSLSLIDMDAGTESPP